MKRLLCATAAAVVAVCGALPRAEAGSTIFERSYYSHAPAKPVEVGPQAHRAPVGPVFSRPQGFAVNSGYRLQRSFIRVGGQIVDQTYNWDSWVQQTNKW
ncbi:MAG: hypothetical protein JNL96_02890 [Planctomycetaceae bacterium]|nr:hypothetical protein [Planctomycetaceae bacterium]